MKNGIALIVSVFILGLPNILYFDFSHYSRMALKAPKIDSFIVDSCYGAFTEDGLRTGVWFCCQYSNTLCRRISYNENGEINENIKMYLIDRKDGTAHFIGIESYLNGVLSGPTIVYEKNSKQVRQIRIYDDGEYELMLDFYDNGMIKSYGKYEYDTIPYRKLIYNPETDSFDTMITGKMMGDAPKGNWIYYNKDGSVDSVAVFD